MKLRIISLSILAFLLVAPMGLLASDVSDATFYGTVRSTNTGTATTGVSVPFDLSTDNLINMGYIENDFSNVAIRDSSGVDVPFMPAQSGATTWITYLNSIGQNQSVNYTLYTGGTTAMGGDIAYFPGAGGMTVPDDASLEPGDDFEIEVSGFAAAGTLYYKDQSFSVTSDGAGTLSVNVVDTIDETAMPKTGETVSYGGTIWSVAVDGSYLYVAGQTTNTVRKYLKSDMTFVGETPSYGGLIFAITIDDTHIYAGGQTTKKVRCYLKSDMSFVGETADYGGSINTIVVDDTHIYAGGDTVNTVKQYLKSNFSYVSQTVSYGGTISSIAVDDTNVYVGGAVSNSVRKYLKSDLSYIAETASYGGGIKSIQIDDTHIYAGGLTTKTVRKYLKSDLSYINETVSYGGSINSIHIDDTHIYVTGATTLTVRKYLKSDLSYIAETASYGADVYSLAGDDSSIYIGGITTIKCYEYSKRTVTYAVLTTAAITTGERIILLDSDGVNLKIYIDGVEKASVGSVSIADSSGDWVLFANNSMPYVYYVKITVGGVLKGHWGWEYDTTFTDQSGNGNDATPTFRTTSSDADVSAELVTYQAVSSASYSGDYAAPIPEPIDGAPTASGFLFTELQFDNVPGAAVINAFMDAAGLPYAIFWFPLIFTISAFLAMGAFALSKDLLVPCVVSAVWLFLNAVPFQIVPAWVLFPYAVVAVEEIVRRRFISV